MSVCMLHYLQDPSSEYVSASVTLTMPAGTTQLPVSLPVSQDSYLYPGSEFTIAIIDTTVIAPSEYAGQTADISTTSGRATSVVRENVSNPLISFSQVSLSPAVNDCKLPTTVDHIRRYQI